MASNRIRLVALALAAMLVTSVVFPGAALAATSLDVTVDQRSSDGAAVVTVTDENGTAIENANVSVESAGNYSVNETTTDANGTAVLPAPSETVEVTVTAEKDDRNASTTVTLTPLADSLDVSITQHADKSWTATVTQYDDPVEDATLNVTVGENESYDSAVGEYSTDENGTVWFNPGPAEVVTVTVTATHENISATTEQTLESTQLALDVSQDADGNVVIDVTREGDLVDSANVTVEGDYVDAGDYVADNGTLTLSPPITNTTVTVTAVHDDTTVKTTVDLVIPSDGNPHNDFANSLGMFIEFMKSQDLDEPLGQHISEFVHANNPAADKDNGPPEHANGNGQGGVDKQDKGTDKQGPPSHANGHGPDKNDDEQTTDDGGEEDTTDD